jgi:hypothetical protein
VEGSVPEVTELLTFSWGKVFFTGSERVGKIVAQATAKTLTPTVLELGGKSPVLIDETAPSDIHGMANRIVWGKTFNAGQTVRTCTQVQLVIYRNATYQYIYIYIYIAKTHTRCFFFSVLLRTMSFVMRNTSMHFAKNLSRLWNCKL